jgi:hypothetical protein
MNELLAHIAELTPTLPGWCPIEKAQWMARLLVEEKLLYCVELGVFGARSLLPMGLAIRHLDMGGYALGIDPYRVDRAAESMRLDAHTKWAAECDFRQMHFDAQDAIAAAGVLPWCGIVAAASDEIAPLIGPIDFLHIDGTHSVLASCRDVETWVPKVRPGGIVVFDDSDWGSTQEARGMLKAMCGEPSTSRETWEAYRV